ncbi:cell division protein FtsL [Salinisphaera sp.]|uniref:cell division protein FtsL n=1 Tax=Salinisphaera sp. TaxID=1914330 RepID=UPI000C54D798|nr:cell division protein FtsL [Salinisphaera sp.]MAS11367.1 cell division protein FtsL [Salinisphaera sp.]|tara:strand:- start:143 stop:412 length:270 start_codon:yes stop_codon:yes gene_type:complete
MTRQLLTIATLSLAILVSAVAVVQAKHKTREMAHELQLERVERDKLSTEWAQLQLEESAWANPDRVAQVARRELSMVQPRNYVVLESQR